MKNYAMLSLLLMNLLNGTEPNKPENPLKVFVIPGQNGMGLDWSYVSQNTGVSAVNIHRVKTPINHQSIDLGQSCCMKELENSLKNNDDEFIVYANSQGTATALNFFSKNPKHAVKCKGLVLESVLASGNSAIYHTITSPLLGLPKLKWVPGLYYLAPYLAKMIAFPSYSPRGGQPIKSVADLNIDGPIIIAHSKKDPQLSYNDARAIYYALRKRGKDAYLIGREQIGHINILRDDDDNIVKKILNYHGVTFEQNSIGEPDISKYQPNITDHKVAYDELMKKEQRIMKYGPWPLALTTTGVVIGFAAIIKWFCSKKLRVA